MKSSTFTFTDQHGKELFARSWMPDSDSGSPRAVVQIIHGLAEHSGRYKPFAEELTKLEYGVMAYDHQGHGKTDPQHPGYVPVEDSFHRLVENIHDFTEVVKQKFPGVPRILFAHSMGSFLTQRYMQLFDDQPSAIIYSGSNGKPPGLLFAGILLSWLFSKTFGAQYVSTLINKLSFGAYNANFKPSRTPHDWITRDDSEVDKYVADPLAGNIPTASFFSDLFTGLKTLHRHRPFAGHSKPVPILIIAGDHDPVSNMGKGVKDLEQILKKDGADQVTVKLYPEARHELLKEINRDEVIRDITDWLEELNLKKSVPESGD